MPLAVTFATPCVCSAMGAPAAALVSVTPKGMSVMAVVTTTSPSTL